MVGKINWQGAIRSLIASVPGTQSAYPYISDFQVHRSSQRASLACTEIGLRCITATHPEANTNNHVGVSVANCQLSITTVDFFTLLDNSRLASASEN
jgi:hypothetical protein